VSVSGDAETTAPAAPLLRRTVANLAAWIAGLVAPPRVAAQRAVWPPVSRLALGTVATIAAVAAAMVLLDVPAVAHHLAQPRWFVAAFKAVTDFGQAGWFLWPTGVLLVAVAAVASPRLGRTTYLVLLSLAVRLGFVFAAVALPSLFVTIAKRVIGRARPLRGDGSDFTFAPFALRADFTSLPSGHSTTAFAAAVALGALFPRARVWFWAYAGIIALSRVVITTHYPSDVVAGAVVGAVGALLVRTWFAARRLGFAIAADGTVRPLPGPSLQRIKRVARRVAGQ
jgi:membrane-associated phospholipid phosphatase